ncbi:MAG: trk/ktr system potassium uptake protein [Chloroflexota bacterium]|nr:trk/ktr system potassium uptake protein [Chloroflexota bacterium]
MNVVIVGCGRTGAFLAELLDQGGDTVSIVDVERSAFKRLPSNFKGTPVLGDGTDMDILRQAGIATADAFLSLTQGDNRNLMASQIAKKVFGVQQVFAKVNDPIRASTYRSQGIYTFSRTTIIGTLLHAVLSGDKLIGPNLMRVAMKHDEELSAQLPDVSR